MALFGIEARTLEPNSPYFNCGHKYIIPYYWRDNNHEVDFVLKRGRRLAAFEVKSGLRRSSVSGLREFRERFGVKVSKLVSEGGIPLSEFLSIPAREWLDGS